ncbi:zinc finger protein 28-like [Danaus plexippus]|uniref:zinc finger protein 28-like n=1 Tax=Danaus plexippus TaxID=13037 RepID=UPI002AAF3040|nr:zinc finger protein 28-like [Danaus plexippus]
MLKCRACLKDEEYLVPFNDQDIDYFNLLTDINVKMFDKLPQHFCICCLDKLKSFIEFREKCLLSNYILTESIREDNIKVEIENTLFVQKSEVKEDCIDEILEGGLIDNEETDYDLFNNVNIKTEDSEDMSGKLTRPSNITRKKTLLSCGLCIKTFREADLLTIHLACHKISNSCKICSQNFTEWPALYAHRLEHLTNKQKHCHICLKKCYKPQYLEYHYRKFHTEDKDYTVKCSECSHTFTTPKRLQKHMWASHSNRKFYCDHCPKIFKNKSAIKSHMPIHMDNKNVKCGLCDYTCKYLSNLQIHKLRRHTPQKAYCKKCTRVFCDKEKLDGHKCSEKGTICPVCGKIVKTHRLLRRHMESHDSAGKYKCERCPKVYKSKSSLATHKLIHDGVRTKQCEYCNAKFFSGSVLIKHRRIHTGEKPYVCRVCCRGFTSNHNLKVHMRVHGEYLIERKKTDDGA